MKKVCVTGCDRGLGLALAAELLEAGYQVYAGFIEEAHPELDKLKETFGDRLQLLHLDISKDSSVREGAALLSSLTDELDVIINNAAILGDITATIEDPIDFDEIEKVFGVNAVGALRVSHALLGLLLKGSAKLIVNISSEAGSLGLSYRTSWFPYCMSKAALNMQSVMIHTQLLPKGGQVLLIHPEWMQTYMRGERDHAASHTAEESARRIRHIIENHRDYLADKPAYINTRGEPLPW